MMSEKFDEEMVAGVLIASSTSGNACVEQLLKFEKRPIIRAIFRSENKAAQFREKHKNESRLEIRSNVDARDPPTLLTSLEGCTIVFLITPHAKNGFKEDSTLTCNMINCSVSVGIKHIILAGSWTIEHAEEVKNIASRFVQPEKLLKENVNTCKYTILRGGFFYSNYTPIIQNSNNDIIKHVGFIVPANDPRDIGICAAYCICNSHLHSNKIYNISGPKFLSLNTVIDTFSNSLNKKFTFNQISSKQDQSLFLSNLPDAFNQLLTFLLQAGQDAAPISDDVLKITGKPPRSLETWIQDHRQLFE